MIDKKEDVKPSPAPSTGEEPETVREDDKPPEKPEGGEGNPPNEEPETLEEPKEEPEEPKEKKPIPYSRFKEVVDDRDKWKEIAEKKVSPPSEEELAEKYPDWETMSDTEKELLRKQETQAKEIALLKEKEAWKEDFAKAKKQFPQLGAREEEFKEFCYKYPKGIDATTLAKSFLFDEKPKLEPPEPPKPPKPGLESPTGGKEVPGPEMTLADVERLRKTNPKLYNKMVREGRFKNIPEE